MRKEKIQDKQNKIFEKLSHAGRILATIIYKLSRTVFTVPDMRSRWGFQQLIPNVWFSSRVPMVDLIGLFEDETGNFVITTRFPTLCCKTEVSRAMEPLDQNGSRTSLQDRNPACKWNLLSRTYDTLERALAHLTQNPTGRHLRHSC